MLKWRQWECKPDVVIYNTIVDGFCKNRLVNNALELSDQMDRCGVKADLVTHNSLITSLCSFGRCNDADLLLKDMVMRNIVSNSHVRFVKAALTTATKKLTNKKRNLSAA